MTWRYDIAYSMGITFNRLLGGFDGPLRTCRSREPPLAVFPAAAKGGGYLVVMRPMIRFRREPPAQEQRSGVFAPRWLLHSLERAGGCDGRAELQRRKASASTPAAVNGTKLAPCESVCGMVPGDFDAVGIDAMRLSCGSPMTRSSTAHTS